MNSRLVISALALASLGVDATLRVRNDDGVISIKSSSRPRGVKGEFSFSVLARENDTAIAMLPVEITAGGYTLEKGKYGWHKLVPAAADATVTVTHVEAPAEAA